ncbi:amino acid ABC transporter permease [Endozoicomonas sp. ALC020]|uniref:amino acid ABC transporter permease n=1 Tax=unclassified Endozoicomonas TaxID=2644528 RepID=UPI003BAE9204
MAEWEIIWQQRDIFISGFGNTFILFLAGSIASFILGVTLLYTLENGSKGVKGSVILIINMMRTLPFLILAYLLYYGLPEVGIRMDAFTAGLVSLCLYHGTYFCEIFRGIRKGLDSGLTEAAQACGFSRFKTFTRIIMPNVLFRSVPLIANQLIICLKDTAFLCIITVGEITAAANSIQSTYFIPLNAFIVAIALYWIISIAIEQVSKITLNKVQDRGLSHA